MCLVIAVVGGLFGDIRFYANPATVLFWIDVWVGVAVMSALFGNVWDAISPLNALGRALEQQLARDGITPRALPGLAGHVAGGAAAAGDRVARAVLDGRQQPARTWPWSSSST